MRLTRFAQVNVHVDETGRDERPGRIENLGVARVEMFADRGDAAIAQQNVAQRIEPLRGIDDVPATDEKRCHGELRSLPERKTRVRAAG